MARILVTDGDERSALAVVRSLGRAGHFVIVGAARRWSLSGASRFASERLELPDAMKVPEAFAAAVAAKARAAGCELVIPVTDASALALLSKAEMLLPTRIPLPALGTFRQISDKAGVATSARSLGIRIPEQLLAVRREDVLRPATDHAFRPPFVLKPVRSVAEFRDLSTRSLGGLTKHSVVHAADWLAVSRLATTLPDGAFPLLIQERIVGPGIGVFLLVWNKRLVAAFAHRRIREKPPSGGVSVRCESVPLTADLLARSEALLARYDWSGVAMIEYKIDSATGTPYLMEINGRFWGSLQLAIDAGVDFPALLADVALGKPVSPVVRWQMGVRGQWLWGEADHLWARFRRSASTLHLPPGAPGRLVALGRFIRAMTPPWHDQVFRTSDIGPAFRELADRLLGGLAPTYGRRGREKPATPRG